MGNAFAQEGYGGTEGSAVQSPAALGLLVLNLLSVHVSFSRRIPDGVQFSVGRKIASRTGELLLKSSATLHELLQNAAVTTMYPLADHRQSYHLDVSGGHRIRVHESGNPQGKAAVVLHGGPGGGSSPKHYQFFDPTAYRVVLIDQRGCGESTPFASVEHNTTWDLVADIEAVRRLLGIEEWLVFGGSWGSTLALAYAQTHPERVTELILRGIFMLRPSELRFFYQDGASHLFPDAWEAFLAPIPVEEQSDLMAAYHRRLFGEDPEELMNCARAWSEWERATCMLDPDQGGNEPVEQAEAFARIENHYFVNGGFFDSPTQLLEGVDKIRHIPTVIVQGRYDVVCPMRSAWDLHRAWPQSELIVNTHAGHSMFDPENAAALKMVCDRFSSSH
ncbi:MAG: prolyl aminopeptidase [Microthrixaceae bacterium]